MNGSTLHALAHPLVILLMGVAVLALWRGDKRRPPYLLCFGLSYLAYSVGVSAQIVMVPADHLSNVVFTGLMYLFATMSFARGVIHLSGAEYRYAVPVAMAALSFALRIYFVQFEDNGVMRASVLHGTIALLFLHAAYVARSLRHGLLAERVTFYAFVLFGLTMPMKLVLAPARPAGSYGFDFSSYWAVTAISIYAFGLIFGLALIITIIQRNHMAKRATDENLSIISHDLRAPLATIVGNLQLQQQSATPEQKAHMQAIERSTKYQNSLIDDILAGKQDAGPLQVNPETVDVRAFLAELSLHGRSWCAQNGSTFSLDILTSLPGRILTDERRLKQALLNLLSNAALATHNGSVALLVESTSAQAGPTQIRFEVRDTGPGMEPKQQSQLFEAYRRFDLQRPGTGLGLYIAQRIADNLAATLDVKSEPGKGSSFTLTLQLPAMESDALPKGWQAAETPPDSRPCRKPPEDLCSQLATYASGCRYSDIQDWLDLPALKMPDYQSFHARVRAALDVMDFEGIRALAEDTSASANT
ncbi:MAG: HAMP domain-containing sensor histidine kinase [Burkholderiaceae bacterium]